MGARVTVVKPSDRIQTNMARRTKVRRAMSLLELTAVVAIVGFITTAAITTFGHSSLRTSGAEGFARNISLGLVHARRATISTGDNHFLQFNYSGSNVTSYALYRRTSGGDVQVDLLRQVPNGVTVACASPQLEFDFDGSALAGYIISVSGEQRSWEVSLVMLTGAVVVTETTP